MAPLRGQGKSSFPSPQPEVTGTLVPTSLVLSQEAARPQEAEKTQLVRADGPGLSRTDLGGGRTVGIAVPREPGALAWEVGPLLYPGC